MLDQCYKHKANNKFIIIRNLKFLRHSITEAIDWSEPQVLFENSLQFPSQCCNCVTCFLYENQLSAQGASARINPPFPIEDISMSRTYACMHEIVIKFISPFLFLHYNMDNLAICQEYM